MTNTKDKKHVVYADILRIMAAFAVVMLHVAGARVVIEPAGNDRFMWATFFDCVTRWSVPLFIMLSGMLFLRKDKEISIKRLYTRNILRIVTAFVFWSFVYGVYGAYSETHQIKEALIIGFERIPKGPTHMWYLFRIVGLYMVLPFVKRMTDNFTKREAEYFIGLGFVITFVTKTLSDLKVLTPYIDYINNFEICVAAGYVCLFVAGWYIDNFDHKLPFRICAYLSGIAGFVYMFVTTVHFSKERGFIADEFMSFKSVGAFTMAFALMLLFKQLFKEKTLPRRLVSHIAMWSKYTFGIYLVHAMLLNISTGKGWFVLTNMPYAGIPLEALIVFVISGIIAGIISWFPFSKYIA